MNKNISFGILGALLVSGLGVYILTPEQLDNAKTCTANNLTGLFNSLNEANDTAYWTVDEVTYERSCLGGVWIPTREWLSINGLNETDITFFGEEVQETELCPSITGC